MKIATYNVNSIRVRMPIIKRWLVKNRPDLLCLQETKVEDNGFPVEELEAFKYRAVYKGEKSYSGVAILSSLALDNVWYGFDGDGADEGSRIISARVRGIDIVNTYVPQGTSPDSEKFQYKLGWFDRLLDFFKERYSPGQKLIWLGDFNVAPEPIDVHNPKRLLGHVGFHPDEHKALARVKEWGFVDIFRKHRPDPGQYSFWDYRVRDSVSRGLGWRVDHIWGTEPIAGVSRDAWIDRGPRLWDRPSDHAPVVAEFDL